MSSAIRPGCLLWVTIVGVMCSSMPLAANDDPSTWKLAQERIRAELAGMSLVVVDPSTTMFTQDRFYFKSANKNVNVSLPTWRMEREKRPNEKQYRMISLGKRGFEMNATYLTFTSEELGAAASLDSRMRNLETAHRKQVLQKQVKSACPALDGPFIDQIYVTPGFEVLLKNKVYSGLSGMMLIQSAAGTVAKLDGRQEIPFGGNRTMYSDLFKAVTVNQPIHFVAAIEFQVSPEKRRLISLSARNNSQFRPEVPFPTESEMDAIMERTARIIQETFGVAQPAAPTELIANQGDLAGSPLNDGDVLLQITDFKEPDSIEFELKGLPPGSSDTLFVDIQNWHRPICFVQGPEARSTEQGFSVKSMNGSCVFGLHFDANNLAAYRAVFPNGPLAVIPVQVRNDRFAKRFFVQLSEWELTVSRFELLQADSESTRQLQSETPSNYRFNHYVEMAGKLWDTWEQRLLPYVQVGRTYQPNEPVIMGWAKDETLGHTFQTAEPTGDTEVPSFNAQARIRVAFDLELLMDPKVTPSLEAFDDGLVIQDDVQTSLWEEQAKIWRDFQVEDNFEITVHEVDPGGTNLWAPVNEESYLPGPVAQFRSGYSKVTDYTNLKRYDFQSRSLVEEITAPFYIFDPLRKSGIYEVRLKLRVFRGSDRNDFREVHVALRFKASDREFHSERIYWNTQRHP